MRGWDFPHEDEPSPKKPPPPPPEEEPSPAKAKADQHWQSAKAKTFAEIAAMPRIERQPLVGDWLKPGAWMLVGAPKAGKSLLNLQVLAAVAGGETFLDWPCRKTEGLYIAAEDDLEVIQERIFQQGVASAPNGVAFPPPDGCHVINNETLLQEARKWNPEDPDKAHHTLDAWLFIWLQKNPKIGFVIIDTLDVAELIWTQRRIESNFGKRITEVDYNQTQQWNKFARSKNIVIILVCHTGKTKGRRVEDPFELQNATNTKAAGAAGQIVLWNPNANHTDPRIKLRALSIQGRQIPGGDRHFAVHLNGATRWVNDGELEQFLETQAENTILTALLEQHQVPGSDSMAWIKSRALADITGFTDSHVRRVLSRKIVKDPRWREYRLVGRRGKEGGYRLESQKV